MVTHRSTGTHRHPRTLTSVLAAVATLVAVAVGVLGPGPFGTDADQPSSSSRGATAASTPTVDPRLPTPDDLLGPGQVPAPGGGRAWHVARTDANTAGTGLTSLCQRHRFADPHGLAALVRVLRLPGAARRSTVPAAGASVVQSVEVSRSARQAARGFRTVQRWYAGCRVARLQLLDSYRVDGVGDQAAVLTLRLWHQPATTLSLALARTRAVTTTMVTTTSADRSPGAQEVTRSLARAVTRLCARSGAPACVRQPTLHQAPPPATSGASGSLAVVDLPPVGDVNRPWVGTRPVGLRSDRPATSCDRAAYPRGRASRTRTYLVPRAALPARFGLSETYAVLSDDQAAARFLASVRTSVAGCEDRDLATEVSMERRPRADASAWDLTTEVSPTRVVRFRLGFVRVGRAVAQLTFTPSGDDDMTRAAFDALVVRAGERLGRLPRAALTRPGRSAGAATSRGRAPRSSR